MNPKPDFELVLATYTDGDVLRFEHVIQICGARGYLLQLGSVQHHHHSAASIASPRDLSAGVSAVRARDPGKRHHNPDARISVVEAAREEHDRLRFELRPGPRGEAFRLRLEIEAAPGSSPSR